MRLFVYFIVLITFFNLGVLYLNWYIFSATIDSYEYIERQKHQINVELIEIDTISSYGKRKSAGNIDLSPALNAPNRESF